MAKFLYDQFTRGSKLLLPTLRFKKTAAQISASVTTLINDLRKQQAEASEAIMEICKRRDISPDEVYTAGDDEEAINTYSNRTLSSNATPHTHRAILDALQKDLDKLRDLGRAHARYNDAITHLERVAVNFEAPTREFDLTLDELQQLGF